MPEEKDNEAEEQVRDLLELTVEPLEEDIDFGAMCPKISIQVEGADLGIYDDIDDKTDEEIAEKAAQEVRSYVLKVMPTIREDLARTKAVKDIKVDLSGF